MAPEPASPVWALLDSEKSRGSQATPSLATSELPREAEVDKAELWNRLLEEEAPTGPLAFVESTWFQSLVGFVIFCNAIIIGLETDLHFKFWSVVEFALLVFFVLELYLRISRFGVRFFLLLGNIFDVLIVMAGVIDMWVLPVLQWFVGSRQPEPDSAFTAFMEVLRLGRIVRLVRLVKIIQPLYRLALGIAEAVQGMFWVLVFLAMLLYALAILCTRIVGHGERLVLNPDEEEAALPWHDEEDSTEAIREMFSSVPASMFALFEMMSCWSLMKFTPLFEEMPLFRLFAVLFYILCAWALLAVMTGVVSEKMIVVKDSSAEDDKEAQQMRLVNAFAADKMQELFYKADLNNSGAISREEFNSMLLCTDMTKQLLEHSVLTAEDLGELFKWLDRDKDDKVDIDEFIQGFRWLNDQISPKSLLKLQEETSRDVQRLERRLVAFINERFDALITAVGRPLRKIHAVEEQVHFLGAFMQTVRSEVRASPPEQAHGGGPGDAAAWSARSGAASWSSRAQLWPGPRPEPEDGVHVCASRAQLQDVEARLAARIERLLEAINRVGELQAEGMVQLTDEAMLEEPELPARLSMVQFAADC